MSGLIKSTSPIYVRNLHDYDEVALAGAGTVVQVRDDLTLSVVVGGPYDGWISTAHLASHGMAGLSPLEALAAQAE